MKGETKAHPKETTYCYCGTCKCSTKKECTKYNCACCGKR